LALTSRRHALRLALASAASAVASIPVLGALLSPLLRPGPKAAYDFLPVARVEELSAGVPVLVDLVATARDAWSRQDGVRIGGAWLVKQANGSVVALAAACPHLGCPVAAEKAGFGCHCHDSQFKLDGAVVSGPAQRGLDPLEVRVESGEVSVRPARFKEGSQERREL